MGRRKIAIEPIDDERNRSVTFLKRKAGLFKKAHELAVLCQVDMALVIRGQNNKFYQFSSSEVENVMSSYSKDAVVESRYPEDFVEKARKPRASRRINSRAAAVSHRSISEESDSPPEDEEDDEEDDDVQKPESPNMPASDAAAHEGSLQGGPEMLNAQAPVSMNSFYSRAGEPVPLTENQRRYLFQQQQQQHQQQQQQQHQQQQHQQHQQTQQQQYQQQQQQQQQYQQQQYQQQLQYQQQMMQHQQQMHQQLHTQTSARAQHSPVKHAAMPRGVGRPSPHDQPSPYNMGYGGAPVYEEEAKASRPKLKVEIPTEVPGTSRENTDESADGGLGGKDGNAQSQINPHGGSHQSSQAGDWDAQMSPSGYLMSSQAAPSADVAAASRMSLINGEKTPVSASLPSRYMTDMLPSPSNYFAGEWGVPWSAAPESAGAARRQSMLPQGFPPGMVLPPNMGPMPMGPSAMTVGGVPGVPGASNVPGQANIVHPSDPSVAGGNMVAGGGPLPNASGPPSSGGINSAMGLPSALPGLPPGSLLGARGELPSPLNYPSAARALQAAQAAQAVRDAGNVAEGAVDNNKRKSTGAPDHSIKRGRLSR